MMNFRRFMLAIIAVLLIVPPIFATTDISPSDDAWYWYNSAVDLANAGKFTEALQANEKALAINQTFPLAWANQAGILVQLGRYDDAIRAADTGLLSNVTGQPMVNAFAAAYYSKGDALRALGNLREARINYEKAHELDPTLSIPELSTGTVVPDLSPAPAGTPGQATTVSNGPIPSATTAKSPLSLFPVITGILIALICMVLTRPLEG
jgi:tetratricopeptide (TPR) repeat protein